MLGRDFPIATAKWRDLATVPEAHDKRQLKDFPVSIKSGCPRYAMRLAWHRAMLKQRVCRPVLP